MTTDPVNRVYKPEGKRAISLVNQIDEIIVALNNMLGYRCYNSRDFVMIMLALITKKTIQQVKLELVNWKFDIKDIAPLIFSEDLG